MSLLCIQCGKVIVMSYHPDHYGNCSGCPVENLTPEQKAAISESSRQFKIKMAGESKP